MGNRPAAPDRSAAVIAGQKVYWLTIFFRGETGGERSSPEALKTYYRACAFIKNPVDLLAQISRISWITKNQYEYLVSKVEKSDSEATNTSIQVAVVKEIDNVNQLVDICGSSRVNETVRSCAKGRAAVILARGGDSKGSAKYLDGLDLTSVPVETRTKLLLDLAEHGLWRDSWRKWCTAPQIPDSFVSRGEMEINSVGAHQKTRFFGRAPSLIRGRRVRPQCLTRL